jgi:hypothetical protein
MTERKPTFPVRCETCDGEGYVPVDTGDPQDCIEVRCTCTDGDGYAFGPRCQNLVAHQGAMVACGCDIYDERGVCIGCKDEGQGDAREVRDGAW